MIFVNAGALWQLLISKGRRVWASRLEKTAVLALVSGLAGTAILPAELSAEQEHTNCSVCRRACTRFVTQFSFIQSCWLVPLPSVIRTTVADAWVCFDCYKLPLEGALKKFEFNAGIEKIGHQNLKSYWSRLISEKNPEEIEHALISFHMTEEI